MIRAYWQRARDEWRANRRLRLAGLVALVFLVFHAVAAMESRRQALADRYSRDLELQARLEGMRDQTDWTGRASQAEAALDEMRARVPEVTGAGLAQAELQNWLTELAGKTTLADPSIRVEDTLDVPGYPDMWQVMARLEGQVPQYSQQALVRALSDGLPWIQAERFEILEGQPGRMTLVVRGYYRRAPGSDAGTEASTVAPGSVAP